ncbi:hypothetical protein GGX14DRAFT_397273 [Mycena pura]|uniref:Uncharacterized protein n=1 Tax=Mycena pura TaxID=153505 RepID=A0AAD6V8E8_9AGAR|nr:hypothetical protein GGX14DRAFT_397273 [Mycena pura]
MLLLKSCGDLTPLPAYASHCHSTSMQFLHPFSIVTTNISHVCCAQWIGGTADSAGGSEVEEYLHTSSSCGSRTRDYPFGCQGRCQPKFWDFGSETQVLVGQKWAAGAPNPRSISAKKMVTQAGRSQFRRQKYTKSGTFGTESSSVTQTDRQCYQNKAGEKTIFIFGPWEPIFNPFWQPWLGATKGYKLACDGYERLRAGV